MEVFVLVAFFQLRQSNAQDREHEQRPTRNPLTLVDDKHVDDSHSPGEHAHVQPNSQTQSPIRQRRYPQDYPAGDKCLNTCHCHMIVRNGRFMCAKPRADTDLPAENRLSSIIDWPHICPQNFRNLADYTYAWNCKSDNSACVCVSTSLAHHA